MDKLSIRQDLGLYIQRALLGMIDPSIRCIAVGFYGIDKLTVIYYLDRPPIESDYEGLSEVTTEVLAGIPFKAVEEICEFTLEPIGSLNPLDFWVYMRKE